MKAKVRTLMTMIYTVMLLGITVLYALDKAGLL